MFRTGRLSIRGKGLPAMPRHQLSFEGEEFQQRRSTPEMLLSVPIIIDLSSISIKMMQSLIAGKNFLPGKFRVAILVADLAVTVGVQLYMSHKKSQGDFRSLPLGSLVNRISGRKVLKWRHFSGRQPPEED